MNNTILKILAGVSYVSMVAVNFLANGLPINNRTTGAISNAYPNLFAPAGPAFSIWGLIYLLLGWYVMYQFVTKDQKTESILNKINVLFIATSMANISWIFAWHYDFIGLSVFIMATLLFLLIKIANILRVENFSAVQKFSIWAPFSVYFGWITVAAIANITVFFVSIGWNRLNISDFVWTSIILVIGATIGILRMRKDKNIAYGMVLVWAYSWILFKHLSTGGYDGQYPSVIVTVIICLALFLSFIGRLFYKNKLAKY
jgi:hypothetical protein